MDVQGTPEQRSQRKQRIQFFWNDLQNEREPEIDKIHLMSLMQDLKDEGNQLFREAQYDTALKHYCHALFLTKMLDNRFYHEVDPEFLSTLHSNRAICCLKLEMYDKAVEDCDIAIELQPKNMKAYYRKIQALRAKMKYKEALNTAKEGLENVQSYVFQEQIEQLKELVEQSSASENRTNTVKKSEVSVAAVKSTSKTDIENVWLDGTNLVKSQKKETVAKKQKMPKKKKASRQQGQTNGQAKVKKERLKTQYESSSDSDSSSLGEDEKFAMNLQKVRNMGDHQKTSKSSTSMKDESAKAFSFSDQHSKASTKKSMMDLNNFEKAGISGNQPMVDVDWPLKEDFDFRLACRLCFVKTGEGIKGYNYRADLLHNCAYDIFLIRRKNKIDLNWIRVRPRAVSAGQYFLAYKICMQFTTGVPCRIGEENCTFPHHAAEKRLWEMDRNGQFNIRSFITDMRNRKIYSSLLPAAAVPAETKSSKQEPAIPGLNYTKNNRPSTPASQPSGSSQKSSASTQILQQQQQQHTQQTFQPQQHQTQQTFQPQQFLSQMSSFLLQDQKSYPFQQQQQVDPPVQTQFQGQPLQQDFSVPPPNITFAFPPQPQINNIGGQNHVKTPEARGTQTIENPLKDQYDFKILCKECLSPTTQSTYFVYRPHQHSCDQNILVLHNKGDPSILMRVRERTNHREFPGRYIICNSITYKQPELCRFGEERCSYAHNKVEQILWGLEKEGKFSISEFILQNRTGTSQTRGFTVEDLTKKHGGQFRFICQKCFYDRPPRIAELGRNGFCSSNRGHPWMDCKVLAHFGSFGGITIIKRRKFVHKTAYFKICHFMLFCKKSAIDTCPFAHSMVERDVWMCERDGNLTQEQVVDKCNSLLSAQASSANKSQSADDTEEEKPSRELCPYNIQVLCGTCWKNGTRSKQDGKLDKCVKQHNHWQRIKIFMLMPDLKEIRPLPAKIPNRLNFIMCKYILEKKKCDYSLGGPCQFAHSEKEKEVWVWMCKNGINTLDELAQESQKAENAKKKITQGESVVDVSRKSMPFAPSDFKTSTNYCQYCGIQCNSEKQWDDHCASEKHNFNVNSDKDHQWNFRQPPWGIVGTSYRLCQRHMADESCQYSHVQEMYNLCKYAHSQEELDEWKERYEWRQMKREMAKQQKVFSYMAELLDSYENTESGISVISEEVPGVSIQCDNELNLYKEEKNAVITWTFFIRSQFQLLKAALLLDKDRLHFTIQLGDGKSHQIASGDVLEETDNNGNECCYHVTVQFTGRMFGSFSQWVIFDFGTHPVLVRKLSVEVGNQDIHSQVRSLRQKLSFDRWTNQNREIICQPEITTDKDAFLLRKYKAPEASEYVVTQQTIVAELNRNNYTHKMHKLLELEELTRHQIISSYNICTAVQIMDNISEKKGLFCARAGELFMKVPLSDNLTADTNAGRLILTSVSKIWFAPANCSQEKVYEANILDSNTSEFDGRGKEYIYLTIPPVCVQALNLKAGTNLEVEVQFQMNRLHFCRMHFAVDCLQDTDIVFPNIVKMNPQWNEQHIFKISSKVLNDDQVKAVKHIVARRTGYTPPFIMYGPFGTGKTETLAQAAMVLVKESPEAKVLICAQSNSAADRYILNYLDPILKKWKMENILQRIYAPNRRVNTVSPEVQKYCIFTTDHTAFTPATRNDITGHRLVITTVETSLELLHLNLRGYFTHVFIDEAAQVLECEAIMPLSLADEKTCVVLTGDHMQISPRVYSPEARSQNFHISLLQRLFTHYESFREQLNQKYSSPLNIFLSINYRTKMEILRFISAVFYGGPEKLKAQGSIPSVLEITPLVFYAVQGCEVQEPDSTSYYNFSEIQEVVERVDELYNNWPVEWGPKQADRIMVVTAYYDQMKQIRLALRRKRMELRQVAVNMINEVQGKEFRALFISTCRTRHLLESDHVQNVLESAECDGDIGDFGFLSDPKLLNTALTRTQSFVAVVGDPVALCSIGECVQIWRTYIKHCHNMKSLYPQNLSYESIKNHVINLLMSPKGQRLKEIMEMSHQTNRIIAQPGKKKVVQETKTFSDNDNGHKSKTFHPLKQELPLIEDWVIDCVVEPDDIYKHLAKEVVKANRLSELQKQATAQGILPPREENIEVNDNMLNTECIKVKEENGFAVVYYDRKKARNDNTKYLSTVNVIDFESEIVVDDECLYDISGQSDFSNYDTKQLTDLLKSDSNFYKHCVLHIESSQQMYASPVDYTSSIQEIKISRRDLCGQAFHLDEVVVELLQPDNDITDKDTNVYGKVVGILKRVMDPHNRSFICTVDINNTGSLIPLNRGLPKIYNICPENRIQKVKKGAVSVYQFTKAKEIKFSHYEKINSSNVQEKLFLVRYLKWEPKFCCPLGIVIGVISAGRTVKEGMAILDIEYNVHKKYKPETVNETDKLYQLNRQLPNEVYQTRLNITDRWCFTIDAPSTNDLEDALSIDQLPDGNYEVGVHISDVSYFVKRDTHVDAEALQRACSLFPLADAPVHMLPEKLSVDLCSLNPGKDRLTLSIFLSVTTTGEITNVTAKKCIINSKRKFSYQEVEDILCDPAAAETDYLKSCILVLHQIAQLWRSSRLGNGSHVVSLDPLEMKTPKAKQMVEDLMITTNHHIAKKLLKCYSQTTPLLCQQPLNPQKAEQWKSQHASSAMNTVALTKPFLEGQRTCSCQVACTCIFTYIRRNEVKALNTLDVNKDVWTAICEASDLDNLELAQNLILEPKNHPRLALAQSALNKICSNSYYKCSGDLTFSNQGHFSLNLDVYTTFTSPLRRYIDLVVHRLVHAMIDHKPCPYSKQDLQALCTLNSDAVMKADRYEEEVFSLCLSSSLKYRPLVLNPIIEDVDEKYLSLQYPTLKEIPHKNSKIPLDTLMPNEKPIISVKAKEIYLKWQERIYDNNKHSESENIKGTAELNPDKFVVTIPAFHWQKLLTAIRTEDSDKLHESLKSVQHLVSSSEVNGNFATDVTCELSNKRNKPFVEFSLTFHTCMVLQVQIASEVSKGLLRPTLQLFSLTPSLDICIEHRSSPVSCFTEGTDVSAPKETYPDESAYQKSWLPVLEIESASCAVNNHESVYIHNINIQWNKDQSSAGIFKVDGTFLLPIDFCQERNIKFPKDVLFDDLVDHLNSSLSQSYFQDFICVRYKNLTLPCDPNIVKKVSALMDDKKPVTWVGHCCITSVKKGKTGVLIIQIRLNQSAVQFPDDLLRKGSAINCTIEWIPKTQQHRRMEFAVRRLQEGSDLAKDIALGRKPVKNMEHPEIKSLRSPSVRIVSLNPAQEDAIQQALVNPFTVIQGPPGTGKTIAAVQLAILLVEQNRQMPGNQFKVQPQILICGPSNKSVDVVADYLLRTGSKCPRIVRVYSEEIEQAEFPLPQNTLPSEKSKSSAILTDPSFKRIALHHLIREPENYLSQRINEYDMLFSMYPDDFSQDQAAEYMKTVTEASKIELQKAEIILSTCSSSSSPKMNYSTNITQIIVDDCGMCMEPESMIPIILFCGVKQIVLFGDHKQLQPVVTNQITKNLGLEKSLIERYSEKAITLNIHYRMHEGIAEFPSKYFYKDKLKSGNRTQHQPDSLRFWPNGSNKPVTFCHVVGKENSVTVSTAEGNIYSFINETEEHLAASIATELVQRHHVNEADIAILSQYDAQCEAILKKLISERLTSISVRTVVASQGSEWDYVIFSTVRSLPRTQIEPQPTSGWIMRNMGLVSVENQVNVAITRARQGLIIIGNKYLLSRNSMWRQLLNKYEQDGKLIDADNFVTLLTNR